MRKQEEAAEINKEEAARIEKEREEEEARQKAEQDAKDAQEAARLAAAQPKKKKSSICSVS